MVREGADDDPVRLVEVGEGRPFREELGVRDIANVRKPESVEARTNLLACPHGNRAFHDEQQGLLDIPELVDDAPDCREIGVAGVRGWGADADEDDSVAVRTSCGSAVK